MNTRRWPALLLAVLPQSAALALDPGLRIEQYEHTRWGLRDGLPGQVGALAQTRDGYLWLGTGQTLYRFDGVQFQPYLAPDGVAVRTVSALRADLRGGLWVGFRRGGVACIEDRRITRHGSAEGLPEGAVLGLELDFDGHAWALLRSGVAVLRNARWQRLGAAEGLPEGLPGALLVDRDGAVWLALDHALFRLQRAAARFEQQAATDGRIVDLRQAADGSLWASQVEPPAVRRMVPADAPEPIALPLASAQLAFDRDGALWLATRGEGLLRSGGPDGGGSEAFRARDGLSADYLGPLLESQDGSLWIGSSAGLDRLRATALVDAGFPSGAHAFALAAAGDGSIWAGTLNRNALRMVDGRPAGSAVPPPIHAASTDRNGTVWLAGPSGVWRSTGPDAIRVAALPTDASAAVRALVLDDDGRAWLSIDGRGLFRLQQRAWQALPPYFAAPDQRMPVSAAREAGGRLWFGYRSNAAASVDAGGTAVRRWGRADGLAIGNVTVIHPGRSGVWLGGTEGLARFDGKRFHPLHPAAGTGFGGVTGVLESATHELWVHGERGLVRIAAADLEHSVADPAHRVQPRAVEPMHSLVDDPTQLRPLPTAVGDRRGRIWLAHGSGVSVLDPGRLGEPGPPPPVRIASLLADDVAHAPGNAIELPVQTRRVAITYSAPTLGAAGHTRFQHRLLGLDPRWRDAGGRREALYTALAPGSYRFEVMALQDHAGSRSELAAISFRIPPAFHQTPQFVVAWVGLAVLLGYAIHRQRVRQVQATLRASLDAQRAERERIARELHDTLLQGMQGSLLRLQAAADALPESEQARQALNAAIDRAEQVLIEGRDRVQGIREFDAGASALEQRIAAMADELEGDAGIALRVIRRGEPAQLSPEVQDEALRIVREALINAFQHAAPNAVEVGIEWSRQALKLSVRDDGRGIEQAVLDSGRRPGHWGLAGMRERASRIGAQLLIRSAAAAGTEVELRIPCRNPRGRWWRW